MTKIILNLGLCLLIATLTFGCKKATDGEAPSTATPGGSTAVPLTASQVTGTHYAPCLLTGNSGTYGTAANGMSFLRSITLNSDLSYSISAFFFTGTACQSGGTAVFTYSQSGTYALGSLTTTPANATQIQYTSSSSNLTVYAASGIGSTWAGYLNSKCPGGFTGFSTSATSSSSAEGGHTCNIAPVALPTFQPNGSIFFDTITLDSPSSATTFTVAPSNSVFYPGQFASYPTASSLVYAF